MFLNEAWTHKMTHAGVSASLTQQTPDGPVLLRAHSDLPPRLALVNFHATRGPFLSSLYA